MKNDINFLHAEKNQEERQKIKELQDQQDQQGQQDQKDLQDQKQPQKIQMPKVQPLIIQPEVKKLQDNLKVFIIIPICFLLVNCILFIMIFNSNGEINKINQRYDMVIAENKKLETSLKASQDKISLLEIVGGIKFNVNVDYFQIEKAEISSQSDQISAYLKLNVGYEKIYSGNIRFTVGNQAVEQRLSDLISQIKTNYEKFKTPTMKTFDTMRVQFFINSYEIGNYQNNKVKLN